MKINIKGIWIPFEILTNKDLSDKEKLIYSIILYFSKEKDYCSLDLCQVFRHIFLRIFIIFSFAFKVFFTYCVKNTTQYYKIFFDLYNFRNGIKKPSQGAKSFYTFLPLTILFLCYFP